MISIVMMTAMISDIYEGLSMSWKASTVFVHLEEIYLLCEQCFQKYKRSELGYKDIRFSYYFRKMLHMFWYNIYICFLWQILNFFFLPSGLYLLCFRWFFAMISVSGMFAVTFSIAFAYVADCTEESDRSTAYGLVSLSSL